MRELLIEELRYKGWILQDISYVDNQDKGIKKRNRRLQMSDIYIKKKKLGSVDNEDDQNK